MCVDCLTLHRYANGLASENTLILMRAEGTPTWVLFACLIVLFVESTSRLANERSPMCLQTKPGIRAFVCGTAGGTNRAIFSTVKGAILRGVVHLLVRYSRRREGIEKASGMFQVPGPLNSTTREQTRYLSPLIVSQNYMHATLPGLTRNSIVSFSCFQ